MRHMDIFSGIGGFALAASWVWGEEHEIVTFCEKEEFPRKVLKKYWPCVPCNEDIFTLKGDDYGTIDLITGGFPCQPFSHAGKRRGQKDDRYLWPETLRIIQEAKPRWFLGENVPGIINLALDEVLASLESEGYTAEALSIPACAVNAPHRRERVWIVAHTIGDKYQYTQSRGIAKAKGLQKFNRTSDYSSWKSCGTGAIWKTCQDDMSDAKSFRLQGDWPEGVEKPGTRQQKKELERRFKALRQRGNWSVEPRLGRVAHGVSHRVDRLAALGNAIVPQVAAVIMTGIKEVDRIYGGTP